MKNKKQSMDISPIAPQGNIVPLVQPDMAKLYGTRLQRLQVLAAGHSMQGYLDFVADIVRGQLAVLQNKPLPAPDNLEPLIVDWCTPPLSKTAHERNAYWLDALDGLLAHFAALPQYTDESAVAQTLARLRALPAQDRQEKADLLLAGEFSAVGSDIALFLWAALSVYWTQLARQRPLVSREGVGVERHHCPVCGSAPVASVIVNQPIDGLRYLHCNLCETQWHHVRTLCTNCGEGGKLNYWSVEDKDAQVKAESCDDCHSYLKVMYPKKGSDFTPDMVVDDLGHLALDILMEEKGYARSSVNPFLFPAA